MDLDFLYSEYVGVIGSLGLNLADHVIIASVKHQTINHFQYGKRVKAYVMSSSKRPPSCVEGSLGTPCGLHEVCEKIGGEEALGTVFEGRVSIGLRYWECEREKREKNLITTRILRLRGLQPGINSGGGVDTYDRYVYVHGTNHEDKLGVPSSSGCLQLGNKEVLELFDLVPIGTHLYVSLER
jgi:hypothetical protein